MTTKNTNVIILIMAINIYIASWANIGAGFYSNI